MEITIFNAGATSVTIATLEFAAANGTIISLAGNSCTTTLQAGTSCSAYIFPADNALIGAVVNTSANKQIKAELVEQGNGTILAAIPLN